MQYWLFLLLVLLLASCSSSRNTFQKIERELEFSPVFKKSFTGLAVYDLVEEKMLYEHNSRKYFIPASNIKLFTYYTGLKMLGDSVPALEYTISNDSLIFSGTGDPSFLNPALPTSSIFEFLKNRKEKLFYLPPVSPEKRFGPGWAWDDYNAAYSAERSAFPIYGNLVELKFFRNIEKPEILPKFFADSLIAVNDTEDFKTVKRLPEKNIFRYSNPEKDKETSQKTPFQTSPQLLVKLLKDTLHQNVELLSTHPKMAFPETIFSIPTDSLYKQMLENSDNFIAEQILLLAANELSDTLQTKIAINYMKENYLKDLPDEPVWVDGSGLSRYNLVTPRSMVKLLEKIKNEVPYEELFATLPVGGKTGTLKEQFYAPEPFIFAKTGSLSNNYNLSGFLKTKKGKMLIFSFMNNNFTVPSAVIKAEMERVLREIGDKY